MQHPFRWERKKGGGKKRVKLTQELEETSEVAVY